MADPDIFSADFLAKDWKTPEDFEVLRKALIAFTKAISLSGDCAIHTYNRMNSATESLLKKGMLSHEEAEVKARASYNKIMDRLREKSLDRDVVRGMWGPEPSRNHAADLLEQIFESEKDDATSGMANKAFDSAIALSPTVGTCQNALVDHLNQLSIALDTQNDLAERFDQEIEPVGETLEQLSLLSTHRPDSIKNRGKEAVQKFVEMISPLDKARNHVNDLHESFGMKLLELVTDYNMALSAVLHQCQRLEELEEENRGPTALDDVD